MQSSVLWGPFFQQLFVLFIQVRLLIASDIILVNYKRVSAGLGIKRYNFSLFREVAPLRSLRLHFSIRQDTRKHRWLSTVGENTKLDTVYVPSNYKNSLLTLFCFLCWALYWPHHFTVTNSIHMRHEYSPKCTNRLLIARLESNMVRHREACATYSIIRKSIFCNIVNIQTKKTRLTRRKH